ncbi:hypothetical protein [Kitasatospora sp. NPDC054795]
MFLPATSLRPGAVDSSAMPVAQFPQFPQRSVTIARQEDRPGAPTTSA